MRRYGPRGSVVAPCDLGNLNVKKEDSAMFDTLEIMQIPICHPRLEQVRSFEMEVPHGFSLDACSRQDFGEWHPEITDAHFPGATLEWGKRYGVEIYRLHFDAPTAALLDIARDNLRELPSVCHAALLCADFGENLPRDAWGVCPNWPERLWRGLNGSHEEHHWVPCFSRVWKKAREGWGLGLIASTAIWRKGSYAVFLHGIHG